MILEETGTMASATSEKEQPLITPVALPEELSQPVEVRAQQLDISPSQQVAPHNGLDASEENTLRGVVMHQMLNVLSRSADKKLSQFYSAETKNIEAEELEKWWAECQNIIQEKNLADYFNPEHYDSFYNEVPIQFKENDQTVYGIIDRLVIKGNTATIIDYKTHPYINHGNIEGIAKSYEKQMQLYQKMGYR